jgi:glycosyltransferase involved in cell wall biosynthesis
MKVLTISDCPSPLVRSGLSRVHRHVIDACLEEGHEVIAGSWFCDPINHSYKDIELLPLRKDTKKSLIDVYEIIRRYKPELIITCGDYWDFLYMKALKMKLPNSFRWVPYLTVDTEPINEKLADLFSYMDDIMIPTEWGINVVNKYNKNTYYVPYGVDSQFFRFEENKIKKYRKNKELKGIFRIIVVANNSERKHLPEALKIIGDFSKDKGNVKAYMHTNIGSHYGYDLRILRSRYGLNQIVDFAPDHTTVLNGCDDDQLNIEYNCSDVFLSTASNEGFCLPAIEAMNCGLPVIAGDHTAFKELVSDKTGCLYRTVPVTGMLESIKHVPDCEDAVRKLDNVYRQWEENKLRDYKKNCIEFAHKFIWEKTKESIKKIITNNHKRILVPTEILIGV